MSEHTQGAELGAPPLLCAFALHRGRYCVRPAGHEATDGRVPRHASESDEAWIDRHGDVWRFHSDGLMHTPETQPFPREYVEKKWGPLRLSSPAQRTDGDPA